MLKGQIIGYVGKDAIVQQHGIENVINFSVCHTDKYKDANGQKYEKPTWVNCSWWLENTNVAQYIKKGTLVYVDGFIEAKNWKDRNGESKAYLNIRVVKLELLGGKREDQPSSGNTDENTQSGFQPVNTGAAAGDDDPLPF